VPGVLKPTEWVETCAGLATEWVETCAGLANLGLAEKTAEPEKTLQR